MPMAQSFFQDVRFYITDKLNLSVVTVEMTDIINDPCWGPGKEFDVASHGAGLSLDLVSPSYDFSLPTFRVPVTLIAAKPKSTAPNMWVYARVFGIYPWILFLVLLTLLGVALDFSLHMNQLMHPIGATNLVHVEAASEPQMA